MKKRQTENSNNDTRNYVGKFPKDTWIRIFSKMHPLDIAPIARTCKFFNTIRHFDLLLTDQLLKAGYTRNEIPAIINSEKSKTCYMIMQSPRNLKPEYYDEFVKYIEPDFLLKNMGSLSPTRNKVLKQKHKCKNDEKIAIIKIKLPFLQVKYLLADSLPRSYPFLEKDERIKSENFVRIINFMELDSPPTDPNNYRFLFEFEPQVARKTR